MPNDLLKSVLESKSALCRILLISFKRFSGFIVDFKPYVCFVCKVKINSK